MSQSKRKTGCIASLSLMLACTIVTGTAVRPSVTEAATAGVNYAEALQKNRSISMRPSVRVSCRRTTAWNGEVTRGCRMVPMSAMI
ncbi:hypothetical protein ACFSQ7_12435 [Paenibacillus rhizoplanae]